MRPAFVILHYLALEDTCECVDSILENLNNKGFDIVIVDNASPNDSLGIIRDKYKNKNNIFVIASSENLGFAKGNNLGYQYAKEKLNSKFIIMINNDTFIKQSNFLEEILNTYKKTNFDVLGPDIISTVDNMHQNPLRNYNIYDKKHIQKQILFRKRMIIYNNFGLFNFVSKIKNLLNKFTYISNLKKDNTELDYYHQVVNCKLHGSALIFSENYVSKYNGLFSKTFMYMEEDILFYISQREGLKLLYDPSIKIYHKEDSATNKKFNNNNKQKINFILENEIDSLTEFYKLVNNNNYYRDDILN